MKASDLIDLLSIEPNSEICICIKTKITSGAGKSIDFIYEIEGIEELLPGVIGIKADHLKQNLRGL